MKTFDATATALDNDGFDIIENTVYTHDSKDHHYLVLWHPDGIAATLDSCRPFGSVTLNLQRSRQVVTTKEQLDLIWRVHGKIAHNVVAGEWYYRGEQEIPRMVDDINALRGMGELLTPWQPGRHFCFLTEKEIDEHNDEELFDIMNSRIATFPQHVQDAINRKGEQHG